VESSPDHYTMVTDLIDSGIGEEGRLQFILQCIDKNKPLYKTDIKFLESLTEQLDLKIKKLEGNNVKKAQDCAHNTSKTMLLSDEFLDKHLDKIESKKSAKIAQHSTIPIKKKKSIFRRIFSK